ncbi:MAG: amino acid ABC transporter ATP-binding protein, partial [Oscillospiraceae bacterium]|nr:amino acid ABC transporter ATP-binding protein [Oscillospiraceae bacterium]
MIEIRHLRKEYGDSVPLRDINAVINDGDVIAVIGPSGTGKSTLLNCMNLLERPTSGQILLNGEDITGEGCDISLVRRKMGMVFQSYHLFGHMTAVENVMFAPVKLLHLGRQEAYDRAVELLRMVGLAEKQMNYPDQMSGGQQQRAHHGVGARIPASGDDAHRTMFFCDGQQARAQVEDLP